MMYVCLGRKPQSFIKQVLEDDGCMAMHLYARLPCDSISGWVLRECHDKRGHRLAALCSLMSSWHLPQSTVTCHQSQPEYLPNNTGLNDNADNTEMVTDWLYYYSLSVLW